MTNLVDESGGVAAEVDIAEERDWDILLQEIEEGDVVPIIGQDVLDLERTLAAQLAQVLKLDPEGEPPVSVAAVAGREASRPAADDPRSSSIG